jgi:predicted RNA-binding Zn-ribbon protein involved in translation (DUF1610 family)
VDEPQETEERETMENDHLRFACPSCGTNLTLPAAVAGVEGPCPQCGSVIRAPRPRAVRLEVAEGAPPRVKPVAAAYQMASQPLVPSTAMLSKRRALRRRCVLAGVIGVLMVAVVVVTQQGQSNEEPPAVAGSPKTELAKPQPLPQSPPRTKKDPALDPRVPPEGTDVHTLIQESAAVMGEFLMAGTLEERLPLIETKTPGEELERGVLRQIIKPRQRFQSLEVKFDKVEGWSEVLFRGELELPTGGAETHLLMVRKRGTQRPKVVVDPFLDGYGGRLREFASKPTEGQRNFQVIASIFGFCSDANVPEPESKFTAKLSVSPARSEIAEAYFGKFSPVKERLEKLGVRYGHSTGATLALRWNTEDDPAKPFLEVVNVTSLDWDD